MCAVRMVKKVAENFRLFVIETYVIRQNLKLLTHSALINDIQYVNENC